MTRSCITNERMRYDEVEDLPEFYGTRAIRGWQEFSTVYRSPCFRSQRVSIEDPAQRSSPTSSEAGLDRSIVGDIRLIVEQVRAVPRHLRSLDSREVGEIDELIRTFQSLIVGNSPYPPEEPVFEHDLIDWRAANEQQWQTGICATLGEDGEPLVALNRPLHSRHILEDDYEEFLPE